MAYLNLWTRKSNAVPRFDGQDAGLDSYIGIPRHRLSHEESGEVRSVRTLGAQESVDCKVVGLRSWIGRDSQTVLPQVSLSLL
jgi:hypothetical protein